MCPEVKLGLPFLYLDMLSFSLKSDESFATDKIIPNFCKIWKCISYISTCIVYSITTPIAIYDTNIKWVLPNVHLLFLSS